MRITKINENNQLLWFEQNLLLELKNYDENQKASRMDRPSGLGDLDQQQMGIIPVRK